MGIVWLASYPKSGNTWLRALLSSYRAKAGPDVDLNRMVRTPHAAARLWFDACSAVESTQLAPSTVDRLRPQVFRYHARTEPKTIFMKAHEAWRLTSAGEPLFPADASVGAVYIARSPLDVVASNANHFGLALDQVVDDMAKVDATIARPTGGGTADQFPQLTKDWSGHVRSWLDQSEIPVHLVRYEDMLSDTAGELTRILVFSGLEVDPERVQASVAAASFDRLRSQERERGFRERPAAAAGFFRRGRAGGWREELSPELVRRIVDAHGETMLRLGYELPDRD